MPGYQRVLLKLSGEVLAGGASFGIDAGRVKSLAREVADEFEARTPSQLRYVAGAVGPTNRTASMSPDVNNPAFRATSFDTLVDGYYEQTRGLMDGGEYHHSTG